LLNTIDIANQRLGIYGFRMIYERFFEVHQSTLVSNTTRLKVLSKPFQSWELYTD